MSKCKRMNFNALEQPVFVLPVVPPYDKRTEYRSKTYKVCVRCRRDDGSVVTEEREMPYEITPESVTSFAEGADYRRDPVGAVANGHKRVNLGDVTDMQALMKMDTSDLNALQNRLSMAMEKRIQAMKAAQSAAAQPMEVKTEGGENNG